MKYKFTILLGVLWGVIMTALWSNVFSGGIAIGFGIAFACCGCLFGYAIDKSLNGKDK